MVGRGDLRAPPSHTRQEIVERGGHGEVAFDDYDHAKCWVRRCVIGHRAERAPTTSFHALRAASCGAAAYAVDNMVRFWAEKVLDCAGDGC